MIKESATFASLQNIISLKKSRRSGHVTCIKDTINACRVLVGKSKLKKSLGDLGVHGEEYQEWILEKLDGNG
jgi:hypothetical protein